MRAESRAPGVRPPRRAPGLLAGVPDLAGVTGWVAVTEQLPDVWATRDYPVLREVVQRFDRGDDAVWGQDVAAALSMSPEDVARSGRALERRGLVEALSTLEAQAVLFRDVSGEAYLLTGLHPNGDNAVSQLVSALRQAADQVADPEEKSKLRKLADGAGGVSREVLAGVLTAVITAAGRGAIG
jgi:hypothetical protein